MGNLSPKFYHTYMRKKNKPQSQTLEVLTWYLQVWYWLQFPSSPCRTRELWEFQACLVYTVRPCPKPTKQKLALTFIQRLVDSICTSELLFGFDLLWICSSWPSDRRSHQVSPQFLFMSNKVISHILPWSRLSCVHSHALGLNVLKCICTWKPDMGHRSPLS